MRVLFSSLAGIGSLHPLIALARAAQAEGHDVAIVTSEERRSMIERLGLIFMPAGPNPRAEILRRHPDVPVPPLDQEGHLRVLNLIFGGVIVELMLPGVLEACRSWKPDIVVRGHIALAPLIAAEELAIPHVAIEEAAAGAIAAEERAFATSLTRWRTERGLPPDPDLASVRRYLWLVPFPASLRHADAPFGPTARRTQPLIFNETLESPPPSWLKELPDGPIVHASLGTFARRPELLRIIVDALTGEPVTLVLATGTPALAEELGPLPKNVIAVPFVPHSLLLPRCDALITHAGAGTLITGIMTGLPMVFLPLFGDQPPNAARAAAAGAGIVLDPATLTAGALRQATREVRSDPRYRERSRELRREAEALPDVRQAVRWLEYVGEHRAPIPMGH